MLWVWDTVLQDNIYILKHWPFLGFIPFVARIHKARNQEIGIYVRYVCCSSNVWAHGQMHILSLLDLLALTIN